MKDKKEKENLYMLKNHLCGKSLYLRELKFDPRIEDKYKDDIIKEQDKYYKKFKMLEAILKEKGRNK